MTVYLFLKCAGCGILGIIFHLFAVKLPELRKTSQVANHPLSYWDIIKIERDGIIGSILAVMVILFIFSEFVNYKAGLLNWAKTIFSVIGFSGSTLVISFLGKTGKMLRQIIDKKTNIADGVE